MDNNKDFSSYAAKLRHLAEERLKELGQAKAPSRENQDIHKLVSELQIHQIELEMQNKELQQARSELESSLERYTDIYDFAPVAYFTLDRTSNILQVNLAGAKLLQTPRSQLINRCFGSFISSDSQSTFNTFLTALFESNIREISKVDILTVTGDMLSVQIDGEVSSNEDECRIALINVPERKQAETATRKSAEDLESLFNAINESVCLVERDGKILAANITFASRFGKRVTDCIGVSLYNILPSDVAATRKSIIDEAILTTQPVTFEDEHHGCWFYHSINPIINPDGTVDRLAIYMSDITRRKREETQRQVLVDLLKLINTHYDYREMIKSVVEYIKNWTGCEAVGIRLRDGDDYPYYETRGFPEEFVLLENQLCQLDENGEIVRDSTGNPCLECMCGNVLQGRFDTSKPFFTSNGSFWSNCTTELLASTSEADRQARTRNRCNGQGYESVALIPLRSGMATAGLIQLNDKRKGQFIPEMISLLEQLGENIANAIMERQARESLRESEERYRSYYELGLIGMANTSLEKGWIQFNDYLVSMLGYPRDELASMTWAQITHPDDLASDTAQFERLLTNDIDAYSLDKRFIRKDGQTVYASLSVKLVRKMDGSPDYIVAMIQDITERVLVEQEKRQFYSDTIMSVTQGKLKLISFDEAKRYLVSSELITSAKFPKDTEIARRHIMDFCELAGLQYDTRMLFEIAAGEAITNAIKHASGCKVYAGIGEGTLWVAISDSGPGISSILLPSATLRRGFSSKVSMGMGYTIMMDATDNILLHTGPEGTTVVLLMSITGSKHTISIDDFQDTWDEI
jgi:PAS domain S-box-containing protein